MQDLYSICLVTWMEKQDQTQTYVILQHIGYKLDQGSPTFLKPQANSCVPINATLLKFDTHF